MRLKSMIALTGGAILLFISSCATAPKPLAPGELRLLEMHIPEVKSNIPFVVSIDFVADGKPQIRSACFYFSGDGPHCSKVADVISGSGTETIRVETQTDKGGTIHLKCYVTYIRNGKIEASNVIATHTTAPEVKPTQRW